MPTQSLPAVIPPLPTQSLPAIVSPPTVPMVPTSDAVLAKCSNPEVFVLKALLPKVEAALTAFGKSADNQQHAVPVTYAVLVVYHWNLEEIQSLDDETFKFTVLECYSKRRRALNFR